MSFPAKLLQWLAADPKRGLAISSFPAGGWFATMHVVGEGETVSEGTGKTPGEAVIHCWENFLTIQN